MLPQRLVRRRDRPARQRPGRYRDAAPTASPRCGPGPISPSAPTGWPTRRNGRSATRALEERLSDALHAAADPALRRPPHRGADARIWRAEAASCCRSTVDDDGAVTRRRRGDRPARRLPLPRRSRRARMPTRKLLLAAAERQLRGRTGAARATALAADADEAFDAATDAGRPVAIVWHGRRRGAAARRARRCSRRGSTSTARSTRCRRRRARAVAGALDRLARDAHRARWRRCAALEAGARPRRRRRRCARCWRQLVEAGGVHRARARSRRSTRLDRATAPHASPRLGRARSARSTCSCRHCSSPSRRAGGWRSVAAQRRRDDAGAAAARRGDGADAAATARRAGAASAPAIARSARRCCGSTWSSGWRAPRMTRATRPDAAFAPDPAWPTSLGLRRASFAAADAARSASGCGASDGAGAAGAGAAQRRRRADEPPPRRPGNAFAALAGAERRSRWRDRRCGSTNCSGSRAWRRPAASRRRWREAGHLRIDGRRVDRAHAAGPRRRGAELPAARPGARDPGRGAAGPPRPGRRGAALLYDDLDAPERG